MRDYELLYSKWLIDRLTLVGLLDRPMMARVMGLKSTNMMVMPQPIEEMSLSWSDQVELWRRRYVCLELLGLKSNPMRFLLLTNMMFFWRMCKFVI